MQFFFGKGGFNLAGKTLVVPIVSNANIAQLAADLLIASLSLTKIGVFDSSFFIPVAGAADNEAPGIATPYELYGSETFDVVIIQQRSPCTKSAKTEFTNSLLEFLRLSQFSAILFLAGVDPSNRTDAQMETPIYYLTHNTDMLKTSGLKDLLQQGIHPYTSPVAQRPTEEPDDKRIPFIPGGGLTRRILSSLPTSWSIPTAALVQFALQGDNRGDASLMASAVIRILSLQIEGLKQPTSWKGGLFGTPYDQVLYG